MDSLCQLMIINRIMSITLVFKETLHRRILNEYKTFGIKQWRLLSPIIGSSKLL